MITQNVLSYNCPLVGLALMDEHDDEVLHMITSHTNLTTSTHLTQQAI